jgi:hypothetical protein
MATNLYFQGGQGFGSIFEQEMLRDLIDASIQTKGIDVIYVPRKLVNVDEIFGEDASSKFENGITIEMYFENIDRFSGRGDFINQFGLNIADTCLLLVSKRRWQQEIGRYNLSITPRPAEGDLIYLPLKNSTLLEIKFVDDRHNFYQLNDYYTYALTCEAFQYSHEEISTGIKEVDTPILNSLNNNDYEIISETGDTIVLENGGSIISDQFNIDELDFNANNNKFTEESMTILDQSETNSFGFE